MCSFSRRIKSERPFQAAMFAITGQLENSSGPTQTKVGRYANKKSCHAQQHGTPSKGHVWSSHAADAVLDETITVNGFVLRVLQIAAEVLMRHGN